MRADVERADVRGAGVARLAGADLRAAGRILDLTLEAVPEEGFTVDVALAGQAEGVPGHGGHAGSGVS
jgi:valyl-tRNA synthetase